MSGNADKFKGKAKQVAGKATNNKKLQIEGKTQETKGKLKAGGKKIVDRIDEAI